MSMTMPFSSEEQLEKAQKFLGSVNKPECTGCVRGIRMCYHTPCIGTVEDMERLINAGYAKNLMLDYWSGVKTVQECSEKAFGGSNKPKNSNYTFFEEDVFYLAPATLGNEGGIPPFQKGGQCSLLIDNKCSLHAQGLKPTQGQYACCKVERAFMNEFGKQVELDERIPILITWNTQRGKDLIERWKQEVGFTGPDKQEFPTGKMEMLSFLLEALSSQEESKKRAKEGGCPDIPEDQKDIDVYTHTYEKPY